MSKEEDHTGRKIAMGALLAGLAGYAAGILTAPKSGKETREDLANKAVDLKVSAEEQIKKAQTELDGLTERAKQKAADASAKTKAEIEKAVAAAKAAQVKASTVLKAFKTGETDDKNLQKAINEAQKARDHLNKYLKS